MRDAALPANEPPCAPDLDESGVDLAQIRSMLDLTRAERLSQMTQFIESLLAIRARNGEAGSR
jgi:hypothetical protein